MDEKAEEDMKVLIRLSMKVVLDGEMMKADKEVDWEVDEMLFQFAFLLYNTSEHHLAAHCQLLVLVKSSKEGVCLQLAAFCLLPSTNLVPSI